MLFTRTATRMLAVGRSSPRLRQAELAPGSLLAELPKLGLGLAALGRPGYINLERASDLGTADSRSESAMRAAAFDVLDAAWANGVRYFDVAHGFV